VKLEEGILLINKPAGITSHDVVDKIRREYRIRKVGHAGTLDPMATGLLIILLGRFTKRSNEFLNHDKAYDGTLLLGVTTDSHDKEGEITSTKEVDYKKLNNDYLEDIFLNFQGESEQIPPMFSAKKIDGKPLYKLARKGLVIKREPKKIIIKELRITEIKLPEIKFHVKCSKGTYVRQLACDIGEKIGCGAHLTSLCRTSIGSFELKDALDFNDLNTKELIYGHILQS
jgi:tRNA pseudouridine55 synthase